MKVNVLGDDIAKALFQLHSVHSQEEVMNP